jgi:hypothetical protein
VGFTLADSLVHMIAPEDKIAAVRATYGGRIEDILAKESNRNIYQILGAIEVLVGSKIYKKLATSPSERMVFAFTWLAREVQNGGFHQYFFNTAGDFWEDVLDGLIAIGDQRGLELFRKTLSPFPGSSPSRDTFTRQEQIAKLEEEDEDRLWDHFHNVTNQYFSAPFPDWAMLYDYVKKHTSEFDLCNA